MATRRPAPPLPAADDPKRRRWTIGALGAWGARLLTSDDDRMAWSIAWRRFEGGDAPCPITDRLFAEAAAEWPDRRLYPLVLGEQAPRRGHRTGDEAMRPRTQEGAELYAALAAWRRLDA